MRNKEELHYVYILRCEDNSYYTGYTNDLDRRISLHNSGKASKYTRARLPVVYIFYKAFKEKSRAMSFEYKIKKLNKNQKENLIAGRLENFWI